MILREKPGLFDILLAWHGSIIPKIAGRLVLLALLSTGAVLLAAWHPERMGQLGAIPFTLIGLALSIFLSFRNNACYDRWWEARKLWGRLLVAARALARQSASLPPAQRQALLLEAIGFAHGLAARLRDRDEAAATAPWAARAGAAAPDSAAAGPAPSPTDALLARMGHRCLRLMQGAALHPQHYAVLEAQLTALSEAQAGCERIKSTPLPFAYSLLMHRTAHLFCLLLPFALAPSLGWWTPVVVVICGYAFFGLDALSDELEDPFGEEANDLPLDAMVRGLERELLFALGEPSLPPPLAPQGYRLS